MVHFVEEADDICLNDHVNASLATLLNGLGGLHNASNGSIAKGAILEYDLKHRGKRVCNAGVNHPVADTSNGKHAISQLLLRNVNFSIGAASISWEKTRINRYYSVGSSFSKAKTHTFS